MIRTLAAESPTIPLGAPNGHSPPIGYALVVTARPGQELRRIDPLDGREYLRWLEPPPRTT
jgi:hypothetical protein